LAAQMLALAGLAPNLAEAERCAQAALDSGRAAECFARMVVGLGGPARVLAARFSAQGAAPVRLDVPARCSGFVSGVDTRAIGLTVLALGGGRLRASDAVDVRVGLSQVLAIGARVQTGQALARVHARNRSEAIAACDSLLAATTISAEATSIGPTVLWSSAPG
jgi:thymidine phosphorylase